MNGMLKIDCMIHLNTRAIQERVKNFESKFYPAVKTQIYKGAEQFTPYLSGDLNDSGRSAAAARALKRKEEKGEPHMYDKAAQSADDKSPELVYDVPYAKYQYYANGGAPVNDFPHRSKGTHTKASMLWVECYLNAGGRKDIQNLCKNATHIIKF